MSLIGIKMRGAIVSTILRKSLSITRGELMDGFSFGEITNFMSTDTDRIVNSCPSFHAIWSIPLQVCIFVCVRFIITLLRIPPASRPSMYYLPNATICFHTILTTLIKTLSFLVQKMFLDHQY